MKRLWLQFHQLLALLTEALHKVSSSLPTPTACLLLWLRSLPLSLHEHLEGWAVNQPLRVILLNNYLLPKECDFNLDFFHLVISAILPTAASAQWRQRAAFQEQNQNCRVETSSTVFAGILLNPPSQMSRGRLARLLPLPAFSTQGRGSLLSRGGSVHCSSTHGAPLTQFRLRHVVTFLSNCSTHPSEV